MTSKPVAQLLVDLGVARSHSRPHESNDNPSEANFKTLKYFPEFPERFGSIQTPAPSVRRSSPTTTTNTATGRFAFIKPASVHFGTATEIRASRVMVLDAAYAANPNRFAKPPLPPRLPTAAWINEPTLEALIQTKR